MLENRVIVQDYIKKMKDGTHEGASPADPKLQDLQGRGQQWVSSINSVAETRGLKLDHWLSYEHFQVILYG